MTYATAAADQARGTVAQRGAGIPSSNPRKPANASHASRNTWGHTRDCTMNAMNIGPSRTMAQSFPAKSPSPTNTTSYSTAPHVLPCQHPEARCWTVNETLRPTAHKVKANHQ